jgi:hypothetical protein
MAGDEFADDTVVVGPPAHTGFGPDPAPPVPEPDYGDLPAVFFKPPLDARRRAPEPPVSDEERALPTRGVGQGLPVVYGARSEDFVNSAAGAIDLERPIGPPPEGVSPVSAARGGLRSTVARNRKFRALALWGGALVLLLVSLGLWGIATLALG